MASSQRTKKKREPKVKPEEFRTGRSQIELLPSLQMLYCYKTATGFEWRLRLMRLVKICSASSVVKAKVIQEYGSETEALNIVAITDGARVIRRLLRFWSSSCSDIRLVSPAEETRDLMSIIAITKIENNTFKVLITCSR